MGDQVKKKKSTIELKLGLGFAGLMLRVYLGAERPSVLGFQIKISTEACFKPEGLFHLP